MNCGYTCCYLVPSDIDVCDINSQDFSQFLRVLLEAAKTVSSGSLNKDDVQIYVLKVESS